MKEGEQLRTRLPAPLCYPGPIQAAMRAPRSSRLSRGRGAQESRQSGVMYWPSISFLLRLWNVESIPRLSHNSEGIFPVNWLLPSSRVDRFSRLPNSEGISPLSWLSQRERDSRLSRLPNSEGISPAGSY